MNNKCVLPWIHLATTQDGKIKPCCVYDGEITDELGNPLNIKTDTLSNAWESKYMHDIRQTFLDGKFPVGCMQCVSEEKVQRESKRIRDNRTYREHNYLCVKPEALNDPLYLDIKLGNFCNLKCRICSSVASSKWVDEEIYIFDHNLEIVDKAKRNREYGKIDYPEFWKNIEEWMPNIEFLDFTGGEPLLIKEHFELLQYAIDTGYSKFISLHYNTNGTVSFKDKAVDLWKHFKQVNIMFSIDDIGDRFEFQRYPAKWDKVSSNVLDALQYDFMACEICCTVNIFNIHNLINIVGTFENWGIKYWLNILHNPMEYNIKNILPEDKVKISSLLTTMCNDQIDTVVQFMNSEQLDLWDEFSLRVKQSDTYRDHYIGDSLSEFKKYSEHFENAKLNVVYDIKDTEVKDYTFNDFVFYWDKLEYNKTVPLRNTINDRSSQFERTIREDTEIGIVNIELSYDKENTVPGVYILELSFCSSDEFKIMDKYLRDSNLLEILTRDNIPIVVWIPQEKDEYITEINAEMKSVIERMQDSNVQVSLIGGNMCRKPNRYLDDIVHSSFHFTIFDLYFNKGVRLGNVTLPPISTDQVSKHFISTNNVMRDGKVYILSQLKKRDLLKCGHVSALHSVSGNRVFYLENLLNRKSEEIFLDSMYWIRQFEKDHIQYDGRLVKYPLVLDRERTNFNSWDYIHEDKNTYISNIMSFYNEALFSVVNETHIYPENEICITEKVFYPIAMGKPFMVSAPQNYLKYLRQLGYQTFPELFDESYDDMLDPVDRMDCIVKNVETLCNKDISELKEIVESINYKLEYNRKVLLNDKKYTFRFLELFNNLTAIVK